MKRRRSAETIVVTGTDTGVGKTVLMALLLSHLRQQDIHALAVKPFCSGSLADVNLLAAIQGQELRIRAVNPFYFTESVAPLVAARKHHKRILIGQVIPKLEAAARCCDWLLIEGSGGLLVPLGEGFTLIDIIRHFDSEVIVVARNKLGVINHSLLTAQTLRASAIQRYKFVLMDSKNSDASTSSNVGILSELLAPAALIPLPFLGPRASNLVALQRSARSLKTSLEQLLI